MGKAVCVYCASSSSLPAVYCAAARELGAALVGRGHSLVYGGGRVGLMGILAESVMARGGHVTGVIPEELRNRELALETVDELVVTRTMHQRKAVMAERADAFLALPGGFGTWEEIIESITHRQLDMHFKPCVILNLNGYYDPLLQQFERAFAEGFADAACREHYRVAQSVAQALDFFDRV